jgi:hypothetical protein
VGRPHSKLKSNHRIIAVKIMATSTELPLNSSANGAARMPRTNSIPDELTQVKRELMQAEVRLAKARATVSGAEADVKVLNTRLRALTK